MNLKPLGSEMRGMCERRRGATMGCVVKGLDCKGDRGYVGVLKDRLILECAHVHAFEEGV